MLSIPHLIVIFVVALVIFGPEKLPELARNLGKLMAEFRRATTDLRSTFETHLRDLEREADDRRIGSPRSPADAPAEATPPAISAAPGIVAANAPHNAAAGMGDSPEGGLQVPGGTPDNPMMYPDDPEELIRQAEAQIARQEPAAEPTSERTSDASTRPA
jgi:TatA/E family protein of Tat protein translocase